MSLEDFANELPPQSSMPKPIGDLGFLLEEAQKEHTKDDKAFRVQWSQVGPGEFIAVGKTYPTLEAGVYEINHLKGEPLFIQKNINVDGLMEFPDSKAQQILTEIGEFWKREPIFREYGFLHRRGYMLYGPAGCHAKGTKILMYNGTFKNVENIITGDIIMGPDSKPRRVLQTVKDREEMFEITPTKGESFVVNKSHILHLTPTNTTDSFRSAINISVSDYLKSTQPFRERFKLTRSSEIILRKQIKSVLLTGFTIKSVGYGEYYGFTIDKDHLYLTSDFTIHHNSGKTALVQQIIARIIKSKGIVFLCGHPELFANGLGSFRELEPDRPIVCVYEDIDAITARFGEEEILSVLDGEKQINKVLNIATTNYPERLEKRLVGRPRRFDRVIKIGMPNEAIRSLYFSKKLLIKDEELKKWVKNSEGFSFAAMAELVISVKCLGNDFKESVEILKALMETKISSDDYEDKHMGFN